MDAYKTLKAFYNTHFRKRFTISRKRKKATDRTDMTVESATPESVFKQFSTTTDFQDTLLKFAELRSVLNVPADVRSVYQHCKGCINTPDAQTLWRNLDKRANRNVYKDGKACAGKSVLIIGAGPCGLRMAIECALLGARVVVVEMRDYVSRNNVLHLWPFVRSDIKSLGARVFNKKFCTGSLEHASIRAIQQMLLKVALIVGVEVHAPVKFDGLLEPCTDATNRERGWHAKFSPDDNNFLRNYDFDVLVGADGKSNTLTEFKRKTFRGKLAIAVTANFVNNQTSKDHAAEEIGGLFYVFNQPFFNKLRDKAGVELENFVYFKDDTHYFVMTPRKKSLLKKGVLRQDYNDTKQLLSRENVDMSRLLAFARETATLSTENKLGPLEFALDYHGREDVAIFDFTNLHQAEHASLVRERRNKQLLMTIVGDTLIEPFWPTGSGAARGFLSVFDAAWMMSEWTAGKRPVLDIIAERETILKLLSQTSPNNLNMHLSEYNLDPKTRYGRIADQKVLSTSEVKHLYDRGEGTLQGKESPQGKDSPTAKPKLPPRGSSKRRTYDGTLNRKKLLEWYKKTLQPLCDVIQVNDLTSSWRNGIALLALVQLYRPGLLDVRKFDPNNAYENNCKGFELILDQFGIAPTLSAGSLATGDTADRLAILSYLTQLQQQLLNEGQVKAPGKGKSSRRQYSFSSVGLLARLTMRKTKRAKEPESDAHVKRAKVATPPSQPKKVLGRTTTLDKCKGIAAMRIKALQGDTPVEKSHGKERRKSSPADTCCICHKHLYVSERQNAHGYFFHRSCFRCATCDATLWTHESYHGKNKEGQVYFLCPEHAPMESEDIVDSGTNPPLQMTDENSEDDVEDMTLEEMAQLMSPDTLASSALVGVPDATAGKAIPGMTLGMMAAFDSSAVAEEEDSDDDISNAAETMDLQKGESAQASAKPPVRKHYYTLATSMRLMVGHEIQREYEEMETEEQELESRGIAMERNINRSKSIPDRTTESSGNEELVEEWMDVLRQKQEIQNKQSKLALKAKLLELQNRHLKLQKQLQKICEMDDLGEDIDALAALTENLSDEVNDTVSQILELKLFLKRSGESDA